VKEGDRVELTEEARREYTARHIGARRGVVAALDGRWAIVTWDGLSDRVRLPQANLRVV
jgi:hypothetical protein